MKAKINLIAFLILILSIKINAQEQLPELQDYKNFMKSKTYVVLDSDPWSDFNFMIKEAMKHVWKITEYEIIKESDFDKMFKDPKKSFIVSSTVTFNKDKTKARYTFISLLMGKKVRSITSLPDLCSIPMSYKDVQETSYSYKIEGFVNFMQDHVKSVLKNPGIIQQNMLKYYNKNCKGLSNKTLYVVKKDLTPEANTLAKIKKAYPHKVKIVTEKEVSQAIKDKNPNIVYIHKVGPEGTRHKARCFKIAIGAADSQFYYFDYHMINPKKRDGMLLKDFKAMGRK